MPADTPLAAAPSAAARRIAVIGGGIAGLVAARELALGGCAVQLFESERRLGGKIKQVTLGGRPFDIGAEAFATRGGVVAGLLGELGFAGAEASGTHAGGAGACAGASDAIVAPAPLGSWTVRCVRRGARLQARAVKFPAAGAIGLPVAPLSRESVRALGLGGAARAALEPWLPRALGSGAVTVAELVRARAGKRVLERLVRPMTLGVYSTAPEQLPPSAVPGLEEARAGHRSLIKASGALRDRARAAGSAVGAPRGGMAPLVAALETSLMQLGVELHRGSAVTGLAPLGADQTGSSVDAGSAGGSVDAGDIDPGVRWQLTTDHGAHEVDAVVIAAPEAVAAGLLRWQEPRQGSQRAIAPADDRTVEIVALLVDQPLLDAAPRGTGALISVEHPSADGTEAASAAEAGTSAGTGPGAMIHAKALTHVTAKWPDRAEGLPAGQHVIRLSYGRTHEELPTRGLDDAQMLALAAADAERVLGVAIPQHSIRAWARQRWEMPDPKRQGASQGQHEPTPPGVGLTGDWIAGTGLAATISHARQTARHLTRSLTLEPTP